MKKLKTAQPAVQIWTEDVTLPTYLVGHPNRNPMFLEKRVYQGSSGRVYPYAVIDRICDEKVEEKHRVVFLENEYLKLMVMPGFGGRIQYAYDKTNGYPFIYHNQVIKPALVGLAGPWLSGGIEFNWPQHHRPGTYCPVDYAITAEDDGSGTLWLSELEPMWHLKGTLALTLRPGQALLEIAIRCFNPTPLPQSFHLWTNPAVHVNDQYQSVFPPDVQAVYDHGKRDVSAFPIARGEYYKVDYSRGVDISWYKNLPVPTSFMAARSDYDFIGGYDHGRQAGVLHVADHHSVPGKKQWVWGCGDFGKAWDRNLTDGDGPYAELMCGVFADNQPDFSWLEPFEEKKARQYFLPYKAIGYVRNATIHGALSLEISDGQAQFGAYATSEQANAELVLSRSGRALFRKRLDLSPEQPFKGQVKLPTGTRPQELTLTSRSAEGQVLVSYTPEPPQPEAIPEPALPIPEPAKVATAEALFLAGLHLEQYRHATWEPEDYYREALGRDPSDLRNNNALGLLLLRRGQFALAEPFFRAALKTQTRHNPNPQDGAPNYNLGLALRYQGRLNEAFDAFAKAAWSAACKDAALFQLAQLTLLRGRAATGTKPWDSTILLQAAQFAQASSVRNAVNQKTAHLQIVLFRKAGRLEQARALARVTLDLDPLDFGARYESALLGTAGQESELLRLMRGNGHSYLEISADYARAGFYEEAIDLLRTLAESAVLRDGRAEANANGAARAPGHLGATGMANAMPMVFYFLGYYCSLKGEAAAACRYFQKAAKQPGDRCFPNSLESILALQAALQFNPNDAHAALYLGNLWYDKRQVREATACWERAARAEPSLPTAHRNLALAYFNKQHNPAKALRALARAFALDPTDARVLFELDLLKKRTGVSPAKRMAFLELHRSLVEQREDLLLEWISLLNFFGRAEEALKLLLSRQFHPWEGGEGKVTGQYVVSLTQMAKTKLAQAGLDLKDRASPVKGRERAAANIPDSDLTREAIELLQRARSYPHNLGEGKLHGAQENQVLYWLGIAHEKLGQLDDAARFWREAATGMKVPSPAVYYNDQNPETIFYQGLALQKLGRPAAARERFQTLVRFARKHLGDKVGIDYFAVSLPEFMVFDDDLNRRNTIHCHYLNGLGQFGLGRVRQALEQLGAVLKLDPAHQPACLHLRWFTEQPELGLKAPEGPARGSRPISRPSQRIRRLAPSSSEKTSRLTGRSMQ